MPIYCPYLSNRSNLNGFLIFTGHYWNNTNQIIFGMRKVLIITYYWPPSGGVGVQRWLKFSKYLPDYNWTPIIYTPANPDFNLRDKSLQAEVSKETIVLKQPIWEPFQAYNKIIGQKGASTRQGMVNEGKKDSLLEKITIWIRGNFFLPDARKFWVKPSIKFLTNYLKMNSVDVIVTTGPPHSLHLIGLGLQRKLGVKWIADFRDPWSQWDVLPRLMTSSYAMKIHQRLENKILNSCDLLITVSPRLGKIYTAQCKRVIVITNGFDFKEKTSFEIPEKFRVSHAGLFNETKNIKTFWKVLEDLCVHDEKFKKDLEITLAGNISVSILDTLSNSLLGDNLVNLGYLSHPEVFKLYKNSYVLLLFLNQTSSAPILLPGKLFEYIQANRFILGLGPTDSDVNDILVDLEMESLIDYENYGDMKKRILDYYSSFKKGILPRPVEGIDKYSRESLTQELSRVLDKVVNTDG